MLDKAKAAFKYKRMQSKMEDALKEIFYKEEKGENSVLVRGDKRIRELVIDGEERNDIKSLINDAMKGVQKKIEKSDSMEDQAEELRKILGV